MKLLCKVELMKEFLKKNSLTVNFKGSSMLPTLRNGQEIKLNHVNGNIKVGNIYIFYENDKDSEEKLVCHRLIDFDGNCYIFKGDNRSLKDAPVMRKNIIAEVVYND